VSCVSTGQVMDVPHIRPWMCSISSYGCDPYQAMDVFHIKSWMFSTSAQGCVPCLFMDVPHIQSQDTPAHAFPTPCSTPLHLVSCCLSTAYIFSSHSLTKPSPVYCWLPDLYDLIGFHFPAPAQGPQKSWVFLSFPHTSYAGSTIYLKRAVLYLKFSVPLPLLTFLSPSLRSQRTWITNKMHLHVMDI